MADHHHAPESPLFRAWGRIVVRHRWLMLLGTLGLTAFFAYQAATKLEVRVSNKSVLADDQEVSRNLEELRRNFGQDSMVMVVVRGDVFTLPFLQKLRELHDDLEAAVQRVHYVADQLEDPQNRKPVFVLEDSY